MNVVLDILCLNKKYALYNFVLRNLKLKYRKSILGVFWTILIPTSSALVYFFVFKYVMKVQIENYLLHVLSGIILWTFFQTALNTGVESIVNNHSILNKVPITPNIFPLSDCITAFINLILSLPVLAVMAAIYNIPVTFYWLALPMYLLILLLQAYAIGLTLSVLFVYLRDLKPVVGVLLQIWLYLTPVVYSESMLPKDLTWIMYANPVWFIFVGFRKAFLNSSLLSEIEFLVCICWTLTLSAIAIIVFDKNRKKLVESL